MLSRRGLLAVAAWLLAGCAGGATAGGSPAAAAPPASGEINGGAPGQGGPILVAAGPQKGAAEAQAPVPLAAPFTRIIYNSGVLHAGSPTRPKPWDKDWRTDDGVSYIEVIDVVAADGDRVLTTMTSYLRGAAGLVNTGGLVLISWASRINWPDAWFSPTSVASLKDSNNGSVEVKHLDWPVGNTPRPAVQIRSSGSPAVERVVDLETSLVLRSAQTTQNQNGSWDLMQRDLGAARQRDLPWAKLAPPDWLADWQGLTVDVATRKFVAGREYPTLQPNSRVTLRVTERGPDWVVLQPLKGDALPPKDDYSGAMVCNNAVPGGLWIPPAAIADLTAGQVIEEDPNLGFRTTVVSVDANEVIMRMEKGAVTSTGSFDARTGKLTRTEIVTAGVGDARDIMTLQVVE